MTSLPAHSKAQIALEFLIVYSFVLIIFILIFFVITSQRAASLGQQQYSVLQLQTQNIASYIDQAVQAGSGYSATIPLISGLAHNYYNLSISSSGVVIANTFVGPQPIVAYGFSHAGSFVINGTFETGGGGISIYKLPAYKGTITISNLRGTIYIDEVPPPVQNLVQGATVLQQSNVRAALFNDTKYQYIFSGANTLTLGNSFSISVWFYENPERMGCGSLLGKPDSAKQFAITIASPCAAGAYSTGVLDFNYVDSSSNHHTLAGASFPTGKWINAIATFNGIAGKMTWYIDGTPVTTYSGLAGMSADTNPLYIGSGDFFLNGSMANIQVYESVLTQQQAQALYADGIAGMPYPNAALAGWWPLDGNGNDYSGLGNHGLPENGIGYEGVVQFGAQAYSLSNSMNSISNTLVGFVTSIGSLSGNSMDTSGYSSGNTPAYAFISSVADGSGNLTADVFNGNSTTAANLIGWWPLDTGYGANAYDLTSSDNGIFNGQWKRSANQTNFLAANFYNGNFISVNSSQSLLNIVSNDSFTLTGWIYYGGPTGNNQGILGNWQGGTSGGFQLEGYCISCANGAVAYINGNYLAFPNGLKSFPEGAWEMVALQYNGNDGFAAVYLNGSLFASGTLPKGLSLLETTPYYIGTDASSPKTDSFNGLATNLQLYDSYLTQQQIDSLYKSGISSAPLSNYGLIAWWPLLNSTVDYSMNSNNGTYNGIVQFTDSASGALQQRQRYATFNGVTEASIPYSSSIDPAGSFSVSFWFSSALGSASPFDSELVSGDKTNFGGFDAQLCGGTTCGFTGLNISIGSGSAPLAAILYPLNFQRDTWYQVTATFSNSGLKMYVDGNPVASKTYSGSAAMLQSGTGISVGGPGIAGYFNGQVADLQVYDSALTDQQTLQLYVQGLPLQYRLNTSIG